MTDKDELLTPLELCDELENNAFFTADQAYYIASELYQPLADRIKQLESEMRMLRGFVSDISQDGRGLT